MIFQCSGIELDTERFSVTRDGQAVEVAPKVFDLLVFLVAHRDQVVSRDQLFEALWPGRVVHDNVLSNDIKLARALLGDDGERQESIKTLRGRGYQFVGEVREIAPAIDVPQGASDDTPPPAPAAGSWFFGRRWWPVLAVLVCVAALAALWENESDEPAVESAASISSNPVLAAPLELNPKTIAILPFVNRSNLEQDAFFVDGFHDDLITQVSRIRQLSTISRTSVMTYRNTSKSMRAIGGELGAGIIIEGGVQRAGGQVRINVQMIDAAKDGHLWAETYTRELSAESVFSIQSEIALAVASELHAVLSPQEQEDIAKPSTRNLAALEAYFRGRSAPFRFTIEDIDQSIDHFQRAIDLDPDFAEAHAELGIALLEKIGYSKFPAEAQIALAEPVVKRALELNPVASSPYEALAFLQQNKGEYVAAEAAWNKAIELNPNNTWALLGLANFKSTWLKQHRQALELVNRARLIDPQNPNDGGMLSLTGEILAGLERFEESLSAYNAALARQPDLYFVHLALAHLHHQKFYRHDQAIKAYRQYYFLDPDAEWNFLELGTAYEDLGVEDQALRFYQRYLEFDHSGVMPYIARLRIHLLRGEPAQVQRVFAEIDEKFSGQWGWVDVMLSGFDLQQGKPSAVIERVEATYPFFLSADADIADPAMFNLAIVYTTALHQSGKRKQVAALTDKILERLPAQSRHRWGGVQTLDAWLHMAMGNEDKAMQSLREWRAMGGRVDLTKHRMVPEALFDNPEFQAMNSEILAELADQRANLSRMEAAGELAPIPES